MISELSKPRRIELILRQIDSLPTLPGLAARLLSLTASDDSHAREVVELVSADPALTAKILSMCRSADKGVREETLTIEKAVVLLGFTAIRNAVLSLKVFEFFEENRTETISDDLDPEDDRAQVRLNRQAFWTHSLAVAMAAETIAKRHRSLNILPDEAFVCGLLHDVGKLCMDLVLPRAFGRCVEMADLHQTNIAEVERRIVGIDHHTAGKRLAEQWRLPHRLQDCIWLHGSAYETLPKLEHRKLVGLISLSDHIARRLHLGYSGNHRFQLDEHDLIEKLGLDADLVDEAILELPDAIEERGRMLGMSETISREILLNAIQQANSALGRMNRVMSGKAKHASQQQLVLESISQFHASATPGGGVQDVLDAVVESAVHFMGQGFYAVIYPGEGAAKHDDRDMLGEWLVSQYAADGRPLHSQYVPAPTGSHELDQIDGGQTVSMELMSILPWITDYLVESSDLRKVRMIPLTCGWGLAGLLLHDRPELPAWKLLGPLASAWGSAIASAAQHEGARRLGEELAQANSALAETQDRLLRQESLARLGEMAAGAAHEMNNPLAVISGRSQLLAMGLESGTKHQQAAQTIYRESHRLSDLITGLHMLADPPRPQREETNLCDVVNETIRKIKANLKGRLKQVDVCLILKNEPPMATVDGQMIASALRELLLNAVQANPKTMVHVEMRLIIGERAVLISVVDDGDGMDSHTLTHALDPFFSAKPAGRRVGMGLPRAQQWIVAHGGSLELRSTQSQGTVATFTLPLD